jgi:peptide/nickel transport system permease protein
MILWRHLLRNSLIPVITAISGWFASLLAGTFFVEFIFNWKGLGKVTVDALENSDLPVVMGSVIIVALIFVLVNIMVDILYSILDPRIALE